MTKLDGQVAIITGGAQGIGEGASEVFCQAGAKVVIWDVSMVSPPQLELPNKAERSSFKKSTLPREVKSKQQ